MNDLQKLLALRGLSTRVIAERAEINYFTVQKTVKGIRRAEHAKQAVAEALGLPVEQLFGVEADKALRVLIAQEINAKTAAERTRLRRMFLHSKNTPRILHKRRVGNA